MNTRFLSLALLASLAAAVPARAQSTSPNCTIRNVFTNSGANEIYDNRHTLCTAWQVSYVAAGYSSVSIELDAAPDVNGAPGAWAQVLTLSSPSGTSGSWIGTASWIRVFITTAVGSGNITVIIGGYLQNPASTAGSKLVTSDPTGQACGPGSPLLVFNGNVYSCQSGFYELYPISSTAGNPPLIVTSNPFSTPCTTAGVALIYAGTMYACSAGTYQFYATVVLQTATPTGLSCAGVTNPPLIQDGAGGLFSCQSGAYAKYAPPQLLNVAAPNGVACSGSNPPLVQDNSGNLFSCQSGAYRVVVNPILGAIGAVITATDPTGQPCTNQTYAYVYNGIVYTCQGTAYAKLSGSPVATTTSTGTVTLPAGAVTPKLGTSAMPSTIYYMDPNGQYPTIQSALDAAAVAAGYQGPVCPPPAGNTTCYSGGGGGTIVLPNGVIPVSSTILLTEKNDGIIIQGQGVPYNCYGSSTAPLPYPQTCQAGTTLYWTGTPNGTMFDLNSTFGVRLRDFKIDGGNITSGSTGNSLSGGTLGIGLKIEANGSNVQPYGGSNGSNRVDNVDIRFVQGSPGRGVEVCAGTQAFNCSEQIFNKMNISQCIVDYFQDGGQTLVWARDMYTTFGSQFGIQVLNGRLSLNGGEFSGEGIAGVDIGPYSQAYVKLDDLDWEDQVPFLQKEDSSNPADFPNVYVSNMRGLWIKNTGAGNMTQWGLSLGSGGVLSFTNSRFSTLYPSSPITNFLLQNSALGGAALYYYEENNAYQGVSAYNYQLAGGFINPSIVNSGAFTGNALSVAPLTGTTSTNWLLSKNISGTTLGSCDYTMLCSGSAFLSPFASPTAAISAGNMFLGSLNTLKWSSTTAWNGAADTAVSRQSAHTIAFGTGSAGDSNAQTKAAGYISVGTKFTSSGGCTETLLAGGATVGVFHAQTVGSCSTIVTMGSSSVAPTGWLCTVFNSSTPANVWRQSGFSTTSATFTGTAAANDQINFACLGF